MRRFRGASPRARRPRTMRRTLVTLLVATVTAMCLLLGVITHVSVERQLSGQLTAQLERAALRAAAGGDAATVPAAPEGEGPDGGPPGEGELTVTIRDGQASEATWRDRSGTVHTLSRSDTARVLEAAPSTLDQRGPDAGLDLALEPGDYRVLARPVTGSSGQSVVVGLPLRPVQDTLRRLDVTLLLAGLGALATTGLAGSLIVRRTLRPLEEVAEVAGTVADTPMAAGEVDLAARVPAAHAREGTEVGEVGRALNHLLENVEGAIATRQASEERMRRFVADASHELRTPLTSIRGYTEMLRLTEELSESGERSVHRLDAQSRRMTALVEDLLLLARLDDGAPRQDELVDFAEIVVEGLLDAQVTASDHHWELEVPAEPVVVRGDARQLGQVVVNLLSNARKHTPAGTTVRAVLAEQDGQALLEVIDDGPGIDPAVAGELFERFTRADRSRSGEDGTTGLGLPIVRGILASHHGTIEVSSRPGRTVFTVTLPLER